MLSGAASKEHSDAQSLLLVWGHESFLSGWAVFYEPAFSYKSKRPMKGAGLNLPLPNRQWYVRFSHFLLQASPVENHLEIIPDSANKEAPEWSNICRLPSNCFRTT